MDDYLLKYEDPDPFTIAVGVVAIIGVAAQLHDKFTKTKPSDVTVKLSRRQRNTLTSLRYHAVRARRSIDKIEFIIARGSKDGIEAFRAYPLRVGQNELLLAEEWQDPFRRELRSFSGSLASFTYYINGIIFHDDDLAYRLGRGMDFSAEEAKATVNAALAEGGPIGEQLDAAKMMLDQIIGAIENLGA